MDRFPGDGTAEMLYPEYRNRQITALLHLADFKDTITVTFGIAGSEASTRPLNLSGEEFGRIREVLS